jgi:hypothetical protein
MAQDRTRASAVTGRQLAAWNLAQHSHAEIDLSYIQKFSSYRTESTALLRYEDKLVGIDREVICFDCENRKKQIRTLCGQSAESLNITARGTRIYHLALKFKLR